MPNIRNPSYMVPEVIYKKSYLHLSDVWGFRCIINESIIKKKKLYNDNPFDVIKNINYERILQNL
jgi:hypothetical protein